MGNSHPPFRRPLIMWKRRQQHRPRSTSKALICSPSSPARPSASRSTSFAEISSISISGIVPRTRISVFILGAAHLAPLFLSLRTISPSLTFNCRSLYASAIFIRTDDSRLACLWCQPGRSQTSHGTPASATGISTSAPQVCLLPVQVVQETPYVVLTRETMYVRLTRLGSVQRSLTVLSAEVCARYAVSGRNILAVNRSALYVCLYLLLPLNSSSAPRPITARSLVERPTFPYLRYSVDQLYRLAWITRAQAAAISMPWRKESHRLIVRTWRAVYRAQRK